MRGRLIFPFFAVIARLDPEAMEAAGPGAEGGFDDDFNEPILEPSGGSTAPVRRELEEIKLRAQIEPGTFVELRRLLQGFAPKAAMTFTLFMPDLEDLGLVDAGGWPLLRAGDRVDRLENRDGATVLLFPSPPGLYLDSIEPDSFGLSGSPGANLLICSLTDRPQGSPVAQP